jgi:hypothetical protein
LFELSRSVLIPVVMSTNITVDSSVERLPNNAMSRYCGSDHLA